MTTFKRKFLGTLVVLPTLGLCLSLVATAEDAVPQKKKDVFDLAPPPDLNSCEEKVKSAASEAIDPEGEKFINTLGEDGVRRIGVPAKFGVLEEEQKNYPEYYQKYYVEHTPRAQEFAAAMLAAAKDQSEAGKGKLNEFLANEPVFKITAHMDKILKSEFMKRAIMNEQTTNKAGELVGLTVQEFIDKLVEMDPKKINSGKMRMRNLGRKALKSKIVSIPAGWLGAKEALARQVESMVTGETAVDALNNRLDAHIAQLNRNLDIFDKEDKYYREQAEQCRQALAYSVLSDDYLRNILKSDTTETDPARALLIERVMLPLRRKMMGLRARLVQLDAVMAQRVFHRQNYRRIIEEAEEVRAVGILVIAGTISNHHATQDAAAASAALSKARGILNGMMKRQGQDFQVAMKAGREAQKEAILDFETVADQLRILKEEMKNEALHAADAVNALPEVARAIELSGMQLGQLRDAFQKGADIAQLIEDRQIKTDNKDAATQADEMGKKGWDFFKKAGVGIDSPVDDGKSTKK